MASKSENLNQPVNRPLDSKQRYRFEQAARAVGADESDDALDRVMGKLDLTRKLEKAVDTAGRGCEDSGEG